MHHFHELVLEVMSHVLATPASIRASIAAVKVRGRYIVRLTTYTATFGKLSVVVFTTTIDIMIILYVSVEPKHYTTFNNLQYAGQRWTFMRCASAALLEVPRSRTAISDRSFSIAGPRVWNTLSASVHDINSSLHFRKLLKVFIFV